MLTGALAATIFCACEKVETRAISPVNAAAQNEIKQISAQQAQAAVKSGKAQFIDVRTAEEYAAGHAPQALNMPLDTLENDSAKLDKTKPIYVICQTGRRSQKGAEILQKSGFANIYNISGGTSEWIKAGLPIEK